ncbi:lipopolysaccharide biosynthesis protein [Croceibacterium ferulae]|uniref:lipopolysaccharide biosynthesis protein n=1 Tax=Croceibacterium ferulae TaxID=1854641 RepID=UPI001F4D48BD|nr:lipopolysaccharide biosynthesis protein [Croceibacterium ferulae]
MAYNRPEEPTAEAKAKAPEASMSSKLLRGSGWMAAARAVINILGFTSTIVLARFLSPSDFGLVALATTALAIINSVTDISLNQALIHHREPTDYHFHTAWTLSVLRGLLLGMLVASLGLPMSWFYDDPRLLPIMLTLGASTFLAGFANPRRVMLAKQLVFWQEFLLTVSQRVITVAVSIAVAVAYESYWALVLGVISGQVAAIVVSYTSLPFRPRFALRHARELWSFSIWLTLGQAMSTINWRFDQLLVGALLGKAALGFYAVGDNLSQIPSRETTAPLTKTLFPGFSRIADDALRLRQAYTRAQSIVTAVALPAGAGVALVASPLVALALGERWGPVVPIIEALATIFALQTFGSLVAPLAMSLGAPRLLFRRDLQMFFVRLPIIITGTLLFGLTGLVYARCLTGVIATVTNMTIVRRLIGIPLVNQVSGSARTLISVSMMAGAVVLAQRMLALHGQHTSMILSLGISAAVGALTYISTLLITWRLMGSPAGPEDEAIKLVRRVMTRIQG